MRKKALYEAPETEAFDFRFEKDLLTGSVFGEAGKAGSELDELEELDF